MKKLLFSLVFSSLFLVLSSTSAQADVVCAPMYGGGQTCQQVGGAAPTATPTARITLTPPPPTKDGLRVFPPPQVAVTPPTGAETIALAALIPAGAAGVVFQHLSSNAWHNKKNIKQKRLISL